MTRGTTLLGHAAVWPTHRALIRRDKLLETLIGRRTRPPSIAGRTRPDLLGEAPEVSHGTARVARALRGALPTAGVTLDRERLVATPDRS